MNELALLAMLPDQGSESASASRPYRPHIAPSPPHLNREARSRVIEHMVARGYTPCYLY
jgi:hypothetical protein